VAPRGRINKVPEKNQKQTVETYSLNPPDCALARSVAPGVAPNRRQSLRREWMSVIVCGIGEMHAGGCPAGDG
jgi:hypothetical protein